eukprot:CAMPEP_0113649256 /NCGR_PEP_ID=MMETSP0017_2-20120614/26168_1 /TAXON_ID=2856 /ORGANISM="Cylindrotheca closterium" /LENGTH=471 /DNA_ID=CAMNT_0000561609 /DNA_START=364 /DNA_END=1779 /DNA_ORIENTATION=+ /assembly_acc=CAM_ASM_000147
MEWTVGQTVQVQSRTWAGINKPGGCARIIKVHYFDNSPQEDGDANPNSQNKNIQGLDVKYVVGGGFEKNLDPNLVFHLETLQRGGRKRRGREFLMERVDDMRKKCKTKPEKKAKGKSAKTDSKGKDNAIKSTKRRILPVKKDKKTENEDPQSATLSSSGPSSPSAVSSPPPQPKSRRKVAKKLVPTKKKTVVASSTSTNDVKPMDVVYTDQSIDVSPLDRNLARKEKACSPEVRRGLFESRKATSPTDKVEIAAAVQAAASAVASKAHAVTTTPASTIGSSKKYKKKKQSKQMPQSPIPKQRSSLPTEASVYETPTQQAQQASSFSRHQPLHHMAAKPPASSTPKLQLPRPPPKHAVKPGKSVPLKRVFENEMQKARRFIDDLIKPREQDVEDAVKDPQQPSSPSRFVQFMTIFNRIRLRMDDGTIEEEDFLKQVNAEAIRAYNKNEIDTFIDKLSEQGKVMKSDGNIYII